MNIRSHFPVLSKYPELIYLDSASTTLIPEVVIESVCEFLSSIVSSSRRGAHMLAVHGGSVVEDVRRQLANFLGTDTSQVSFQKSIPTAVVSFALGYDWKAKGKDTILVAESEEHSVLVALRRLSEILHLNFKLVPIDRNGHLDLGVLEDLLDDLVGIVAICSRTLGWGVQNPLREISTLVHDYDVTLISDMSRSFGFELPEMINTGVNIAFASANMSFMAPPGLVIQWTNQLTNDHHTPGILGGSGVTDVNLAGYNAALPPDKFESGMLNIPAIAGLGKGLEYLTGIGKERIESHLTKLATNTRRRLESISSLTLYGTTTENTPILGFNLGSEDLISCHDIALFLDESNIAVRSGLLCAHPLVKQVATEGIIQMSLSIYNTPEEIDKVADTLEIIAKDLV